MEPSALLKTEDGRFSEVMTSLRIKNFHKEAARCVTSGTAQKGTAVASIAVSAAPELCMLLCHGFICPGRTCQFCPSPAPAPILTFSVKNKLKHNSILFLLD